MGSSSSGYWRTHKTRIESLLCLDVYRLKELDIISYENKAGVLYWGKDTENESSIGYNYFAESNSLILNYKSNDYPVKDEVRLSKIKTNFGGFRWAFLCPKCGSRRIKLYMKNRYFRCRECHNLVHSSSQESYMNRLIRKNHKIQDSLDGEGLCIKPKYMRWKTYDRIMDKKEQVDNEFAYQMFTRYNYFC